MRVAQVQLVVMDLAEAMLHADDEAPLIACAHQDAAAALLLLAAQDQPVVPGNLNSKKPQIVSFLTSCS